MDGTVELQQERNEKREDAQAPYGSGSLYNCSLTTLRPASDVVGVAGRVDRSGQNQPLLARLRVMHLLRPRTPSTAFATRGVSVLFVRRLQSWSPPRRLDRAETNNRVVGTRDVRDKSFLGLDERLLLFRDLRAG